MKNTTLSTFGCLFIMLPCSTLALGQSSHHEHHEYLGQSEISSKEDIVNQFETALSHCSQQQDRSAEPKTLDDITRQMEILRTIHSSAKLSASQLSSDPQLQSMLSDLLEQSLDLRIHTPVSVSNIFSLAHLIPDVHKRTSIIIKAIQVTDGHSTAVWNFRLHELVDQAAIDTMRDRVTVASDPAKISSAEVFFIALRGTQEDQLSITEFAKLIHRYEQNHGLRLPNGLNYSTLTRLIDLQNARTTPSKLIQWAISAPEFGDSYQAIWALDEVYSQVGVHSDVWENMWPNVTREVQTRLSDYIRRTTLVDGVAPDPSFSDIYVANKIRSWITWAQENGVIVPDSIAALSPDQFIFSKPTIN